eukprot:339259-Rhodomonas_salina.1
MGVFLEIDEKDVHCIMPFHVDVRKKNGKKRLCHDERYINRNTKKKKFKVESHHREGREVLKDCVCGWMIDISHAYYHVMMNKAYHKYMCFRWRGK